MSVLGIVARQLHVPAFVNPSDAVPDDLVGAREDEVRAVEVGGGEL